MSFEEVTIGDARLILGDCREVLPTLPKVDAVITDPPYEEEAHTLTRRTMAFLEGRSVYEAIDFGKIDESAREALKEIDCAGWLLAFCQAEAVGKYQSLFGEKYKRPAIWVKPDSSPQFTGDRPAMGYESIICCWMGGGRSSWNAGGKRGVYTHKIRDGATREHPTQKPIALISELLKDFTLNGCVVLDPFMGSGTTGVAAIQMGRKFIGIEREPKYFEIACRRIEQAYAQPMLFDLHDASHKPEQVAML